MVIGYITIDLDTNKITLRNNNKNYTIPFSLVNNTITVDSIYYTAISPPKLKLDSSIKVQISDLNNLIQYVNFVMICCTLEYPDEDVFDLTQEKFYREYEKKPEVDPFEKLYECDGIFIQIIKDTKLISLPNESKDIQTFLALTLPDPTTKHQQGMKQKYYPLILQSLSKYDVFTIKITVSDSNDSDIKHLFIDILSNRSNQEHVTISLSYSQKEFIYEIEATEETIPQKKISLFSRQSKTQTKTTKIKKGASLSSILHFLDEHSTFNLNTHHYFILYIDTNQILFNNSPENRTQLQNFSTDTEIFSNNISFFVNEHQNEMITPQFNSFFKINHKRPS